MYKYFFTDVDDNRNCIIEQSYKSEKQAFQKAYQKLARYGSIEISLKKVEKNGVADGRDYDRI